MKSEINIIFPCGYNYKYSLHAWFSLFVSVKFDDTKFPICPIHGSDCKRNR